MWADKHSDLKLQVLGTLEMAPFGPLTSVWKVARCSMGETTGPQMDFNSLSVMEESKKPTVSASGVTGMAMDP